MNRLLIGAVVAALAVTGFADNGLAGPGDPSVAAIQASAAATAAGVTTVVSDGPNGFRIVTFFSGGIAFQVIESSNPNVGGGNTGGNTGGGAPPSVAENFGPGFGAVADIGVQALIPAPLSPELQLLLDAVNKLCDLVAKIKAEVAELEIKKSIASKAIDTEILDDDAFPDDLINFINELENVNELLAAARARLEAAKRNCTVSRDNPGELVDNYAPASELSPGAIAINRAINTPYTFSASLLPFANGVNGSVSVADPNARRPWAIFLNSGITGLDDDRTGADRRSRVFNVTAGGAVRWNPKTTIGLSVGYRDGEVTSRANASRLTGEYVSATLSGDYQLMEALSLGLAATYARGDNTLAIGGGTGNFGVNLYSLNASLSRTFRYNDAVISPSLSAAISQTERDSYTDSNAVFVPGSSITSGNVSIGASIAKTFRNTEGFSAITPSLSLGTGYFFRDDLDAALTSGAIARELGLGGNLAAGLDMQLQNGLDLNIGGSYGIFENSVQIWSLNATLAKTF